MLTKELEGLIAAAGRAEADEKHRGEVAQTRDERERAEHRETEARACDDAATNARVVFDWLVSAEAVALREGLRRNGLRRARLGGSLGILRGERRPTASLGGVMVDVVADAPAVRVHVQPGYVGGRVTRVESAERLAAVMPLRALATLADEVREGNALDLVAHGLTTRTL